MSLALCELWQAGFLIEGGRCTDSTNFIINLEELDALDLCPVRCRHSKTKAARRGAQVGREGETLPSGGSFFGSTLPGSHKPNFHARVD